MQSDSTFRFEDVALRLSQAAENSGRTAQEVLLVAVSKRQTLASMIEYADFCRERSLIPNFGENYIQEFEEKKLKLNCPHKVHLIGALQSNKAAKAVELFDCVQTVDSEKLALRLNKYAKQNSKVLPIFVQVNISSDSHKAGVGRNELSGLVRLILSNCPNLELDGLMTITRLYAKAGDVRGDYRAMRNTRDELLAELEELDQRKLRLSMGMSQDFEIAVEEGADLVRVGSALFGERS